MTWIGINDFCGLEHFDRANHRTDCGMLVRGSLVIEAKIEPSQSLENGLIDYSHFQSWQRGLSVKLTSRGDIRITIEQGPSQSYVQIANAVSPLGSHFRLTISWDAPNRIGVATFEDIERGQITQAQFPSPLPIPIEDLERIFTLSDSISVDSSVTSLALSDRIETVGLTPSFAKGCRVTTQSGARAIERLKVGDLVLTKKNALQPIRWIIEQTVPAAASLAPIKLRAPYLGLSHDVVVARHQRVMMTGTSAEYLFGQESVMVQAGHLLGHPSAHPASTRRTITYYQIILDRADCFELGGAWVASQIINTANHPPMIKATDPLADMPAPTIPNHRTPDHSVLQGYETTSLLDTLTA